MRKKKMILNPNEETRLEIKQAIKENNGYCPCTTIKTSDTKCPCKAFRDNLICICELYVEEK
jgi:hypothetical protein